MYSDVDEDEMPNQAFSILDSMGESRQGFDVDEAEPRNQEEIPEPAEVGECSVEETQWTRCAFTDVPSDDPEAFSQSTRVSAAAIECCSSPMSILLYMLPHHFWEHIARCSDKKRIAFLAKPNEVNASGDSRRKDQKYMKKPIRPQRVFAFILVLVLNMLQPFAGSMDNHWRTDNSFFRRAGVISSIMTRDEFRTICRCLCFYNPADLDPNDKFTKIRYVADMVNKAFKSPIRLGAFVSFDEATFFSRSTYLPHGNTIL